MTPGRAGARVRPGETVLHLGEAPRLMRTQLGEVRAVPVMVEAAAAPYRNRRSVEVTVLAAPAVVGTGLPPCSSCGAGLADADYVAAGAEIVPHADAVFDRAEMIVKVKEPLKEERRKLKAGQVLFTYLHLAPDPEQTDDLLASGVIAIAYETVTS